MVKFINKLTGAPMYVADDRVDEYVRLGHKQANDDEARELKAAAPKPRRRGKKHE